jgi:hypothetical protein
MNSSEKFIAEILASRRKTEANGDGLIAVQDALVAALSEANPSHPLLKRKERNRIFCAARDASL